MSSLPFAPCGHHHGEIDTHEMESHGRKGHFFHERSGLCFGEGLAMAGPGKHFFIPGTGERTVRLRQVRSPRHRLLDRGLTYRRRLAQPDFGYSNYERREEDCGIPA